MREFSVNNFLNFTKIKGQKKTEPFHLEYSVFLLFSFQIIQRVHRFFSMEEFKIEIVSLH